MTRSLDVVLSIGRAFLLSGYGYRRAKDVAPRRLLLVTLLLFGCANGTTRADTKATDDARRVSNGLQVLYTFTAGGGNVVRDRAEAGVALNLKIEQPSAVQWGNGSLRVRSSTKILSIESARRINGAIRRANALSVEAWIKPESETQSGPARIVSLSANPNQRNLTLGQDGRRYDLRLRATSTSVNGTPSTPAPNGTAKTKLAHVVFTRDSSGNVRAFVDGKQRSSRRVSGKLSGWDERFRLSLANEVTGDRPWLGELYLVAIYSRDLRPAEVEQNFRAGPLAGLDPQAAERLARAKSEREFATAVAPLLARRCIECHDAASRKGGLDLSRKELAFAGGESGKAIVPGKPRESLLWEQVDAGEMPPRGEPLSSDEKRLLKRWIDEGAVWSVKTIDPVVYARNSGASEAWVQRLTVAEYVETVQHAVGVDVSREARELLPADLRADGFSNTAYNLNVDLKHVEAYARLARQIVKRMDVRKFAARFSRSRSLNTDATARKFVAAAGAWILRGPLNDREITNYSGILTAVASAGGSYEQGVGLMLEAMLQSPRFVYRIEQQQGDGDERRVDDYELASRMSYIVWGGPPDSDLYQAAGDGKLSNPDVCRSHVERMLGDPRAVSRSLQFVSDWLNLDRLNNMRPNADRYPNWEPELGRDMRAETLAFFREVAWVEKRPLRDLFNAQFTFATPRLAKHYGLQPQGEGLQKYDLASVPSRGGLLTQASVLTIGGDDASMVTRGLFVLTDVLRGVIGAPPPGVDTTPVPAKPGLTLRKIAERRITNEACGGCHKKFEPLAFGLEPFDGLGAVHQRDEFGNSLRADGELLIPGTAEPIAYANSAELMDLLAGSDRVQETIAWKLTQFALGRPLGAADANEVERIHQAAKKDGGTYTALVTAIVMSDLVQKTRTQK